MEYTQLVNSDKLHCLTGHAIIKLKYHFSAISAFIFWKISLAPAFHFGRASSSPIISILRHALCEVP